jgi:cell division septal protein FtsQ
VVGIGLVVLAALFGIWSLLHSSLFAARAISVVGAAHETTAQIEAAGRLTGHPPLFDVNTTAAAHGIERLPWVRRASVSLHWPDGVQVHVLEETPKVVMVAPGANGPSSPRRAGCSPM